MNLSHKRLCAHIAFSISRLIKDNLSSSFIDGLHVMRHSIHLVGVVVDDLVRIRRTWVSILRNLFRRCRGYRWHDIEALKRSFEPSKLLS